MTIRLPWLRDSRVTIRARLFLATTLLLGVISIFLYWFFPNRLEHQAIRASVDKANSIAGMTAYSISPALYFADRVGIEEVFASARQIPELVYVKVVDSSGAVISGSDYQDPAGEELPPPELWNRVSANAAIFHAATSILHNGTEIGMLHLGISLASVRHEVAASRRTAAWVGLAVFLIGLITMFAVSTAVTGPLRSMAATAEVIARGDLSKRALIKTRDEIGELACSFNAMVDNLEQAQAELERFNRELEYRVAERTRELESEVDERRSAEQALWESERLLREAQRIAHLGHWRLDAKTGGMTGSDEFFKISGLDPGNATLQAFTEVVHPDDREFGLYHIRRGIETGKQWDTEHRLVRADGIEKAVHVRGSAVTDETGKIVTLLGTVQDITERRRAEEDRRRIEAQAQQSQRMESLGVLAGGVAHDFNNMLATITGFAELALARVGPGSEVAGYIQQQLVAAHRAAELVSQILAFSKRTYAKGCIVSMGDIVEEAAKLLRGTLPSSIVLGYEISDQVPSVLADATRIQQVIMNLGANALHAMAEDGGGLNMVLTTHRVDATEAQLNPHANEGEYVHLAVSDTGIGIQPEVLDRVFEPFFTTRKVGGGSGMGLATSHGIIANHGGFMRVESKVGKGSVFHVYLPVVEGEPEPVAVQEVAEKPQHGKERVLVVDDEPTVLMMVSQVLEFLGYTVTSFSNGLDALEELQQSPDGWDLIITDQTMPEIGGIEILKAARQLRGDLPVVIMTGHSDKLDGGLHGGVGADAVLRKPFRSQKLAATVRQALDSPPPGDPS